LRCPNFKLALNVALSNNSSKCALQHLSNIRVPSFGCNSSTKRLHTPKMKVISSQLKRLGSFTKSSIRVAEIAKQQIGLPQIGKRSTFLSGNPCGAGNQDGSLEVWHRDRGVSERELDRPELLLRCGQEPLVTKSLGNLSSALASKERLVPASSRTQTEATKDIAPSKSQRVIWARGQIACPFVLNERESVRPTKRKDAAEAQHQVNAPCSMQRIAISLTRKGQRKRLLKKTPMQRTWPTTNQDRVQDDSKSKRQVCTVLECESPSS
jgi:hypothetical protein